MFRSPAAILVSNVFRDVSKVHVCALSPHHPREKTARTGGGNKYKSRDTPPVPVIDESQRHPCERDRVETFTIIIIASACEFEEREETNPNPPREGFLYECLHTSLSETGEIHF